MWEALPNLLGGTLGLVAGVLLASSSCARHVAELRAKITTAADNPWEADWPALVESVRLVESDIRNLTALVRKVR